MSPVFKKIGGHVPQSNHGSANMLVELNVLGTKITRISATYPPRNACLQHGDQGFQ